MNLIKIAHLFIKKYAFNKQEISRIIYDYYSDFLKGFNSKDYQKWKDQVNIDASKYKKIFKDDVITIASVDKTKVLYIYKIEDLKLINKLSKNNYLESEGFIKGTLNIPNLYWREYSVPNIYEKEYQGYEFLKDAISYLFPGDDVTLNSRFKSFVKANKIRIDNMLPMIEIRPPKYLGGGMSGAAYQISKDKILKIFTGDWVYNSLKKSQDSLYKNDIQAPEEPMIYDLGLIGKMFSIPVYFVIMEKFKTNMKKSDLNTFDSILKYFSRKIEELAASYGEISNLKESELDDFTKELKNSLGNKSINAYQDLVTKYKLRSNIDHLLKTMVLKYATEREDLHAGNIGISNRGKPIFFDSAYFGEPKKRIVLLKKELNKVFKIKEVNNEIDEIKQAVSKLLKEDDVSLIKLMNKGFIDYDVIVDGVNYNGLEFYRLYNVIRYIAEKYRVDLIASSKAGIRKNNNS